MGVPSGNRGAIGALKAIKGLGGVPRFWKSRAERLGPARCVRFYERAIALAAADTPIPLDDAGPLISFLVPRVEAKGSPLGGLLRSFRRQAPGSCELILCGDDGPATPRETAPGVIVARSSGGVTGALRAGLAAARAPWVARLDAEGALAPFAIDRIARALRQHPECHWLYTDEVIIDARSRPIEALLKPAWDPVLFESLDYVGRLSVYRRERVEQVGGWREAENPDHDLASRYAEGLVAEEIRHLPYPAYLGRRPAPSPTARPRAMTKVRPRVSVVIPSRDSALLIRRVLDGVLAATDYPAFDILVVDNGSTEPEVLALYAELATREPRFRFHIAPETFNFSRAVNRGVAMTNGELVLLLNNDVEILHPGWLDEMVANFDRADVGVVGAKLLYPDGTLQHAGVIAGLGGYAGHWFIGRARDFPGPMGRLGARQSLSVVTGACMLISRKCLDEVGPFDDAVFPIAYNDVDFCLRAVARGYRVIWTPFATLAHHESASRGSDEAPATIARFNRDKASLRARHGTDVLEDRAFNPWYSRGESVPHPVALDRLPEAR
jgi:GT2 family glycosyltransferase